MKTSTANSKKPPLSPSSSSSPSSSLTARTSSSSSRKTRKRSSSDGSATNPHGYEVVNFCLRSVLCHPLALPLLYDFRGENMSRLGNLARKRVDLDCSTGKSPDDVLISAVEKFRTIPVDSRREASLTKIITKEINELSSKLAFHAVREGFLKDQGSGSGRMDVLLAPIGSDEYTPYNMIEFGLKNNDWWKKLDQNLKNLDRIIEGGQKVQFQRPMLFTVVTLEDNEEDTDIKFPFKIGVFLCSQRENGSKSGPKFRMALLWHATAASLTKASNLFGRLLRVTHDFQIWISDQNGDHQYEYEYLSSNCCRVQFNGEDMVLRSYDNRVRKTDRSPIVYLDEECESIVGKTKEVLRLLDGMDPSSDDIGTQSNFWKKGDKENPDLLILATPYRKGTHTTAKPRAFIPIIHQLKELHKKGYVHGDIRAFNVVFGESHNEGWLIDFDFAGKEERYAVYPEGYKRHLEDGHRLGEGGDKITKHHDWHALAQLIFYVHIFRIPDMLKEQVEDYYDACYAWMNLEEDKPTEEMIKNLESFLESIDKGCLIPNKEFAKCLQACEESDEHGGVDGNLPKWREVTAVGATGSPPQKK